MAGITVQTSIAAQPEIVWRVLTDLERQASWMVDVRSLRFATPQRAGVGTVIHVRSELFGVPLVRDVMEITAWEAPRRLAVAHRGAFHGSGEFRVAPDPGGSVLTWSERFRPPLGPLGELAFRLVVGPHLRRVFARSLANLRGLAECAERADHPRG
jgi:uncharacterized protein YndB with AHSA1/START domain